MRENLKKLASNMKASFVNMAPAFMIFELPGVHKAETVECWHSASQTAEPSGGACSWGAELGPGQEVQGLAKVWVDPFVPDSWAVVAAAASAVVVDVVASIGAAFGSCEAGW